MTQLSIKNFETLQDGLDALLEQEKTENNKENKKLLRRIRKAEDALISIGRLPSARKA